MEQSPLEKELEQIVYGHRLLILLETNEGFSQILLTKEHFKTVSDAVAKGFPLELFDGMSDFFEEETTP